MLLVFPPRAANYFLRLELGRVHVKYRILKVAIRFHSKLIHMQPTRLPKIIFEGQWLQHNTTSPYKEEKSWIKTYGKTLNYYGSSVENMQILIQNGYNTAITNFMAKVASNLMGQDFNKALQSNTYNYYKPPFINYEPPRYSRSVWPLYIKRLNAALRNNSEWIPLGKNKALHLYKYEACPLCNVSNQYNIFHVLSQCIQLEPYRNQNVCKSQLYPEENYIQTFSNLSFPQLKEIYKLLCIHVKQVDLTV